MEFKEYNSPEENNYDITSSLYFSESFNSDNQCNPYVEQLTDLVGILEDVSEVDLLQNYGISLQEYYNPNAETISKVRETLGIKKR